MGKGGLHQQNHNATDSDDDVPGLISVSDSDDATPAVPQGSAFWPRRGQLTPLQYYLFKDESYRRSCRTALTWGVLSNLAASEADMPRLLSIERGRSYAQSSYLRRQKKEATTAKRPPQRPPWRSG